MKLIVIFLVLLMNSLATRAAEMNQTEMEIIIKSIADSASGDPGYLELTYKGVNIYVISDIKNDRMRIISPIVKRQDLTTGQIDAIMESNFHRALDARYAVSDDILFSIYIHPMSPLDKKQIESAMLQVANLAISFGNQYTSGVLSFGGK